jgi:GNAT superfamily N-acetyltransferase
LKPTISIRPARRDECSALSDLIARSLRGLSDGFYTPTEVEGALQGSCAVDTQLIDDGTYFVAVEEDRLVGCGGWSYRRTLFGGDTTLHRDAGVLDPAVDAARIRAFFVDPDHARQGIGRAILERCEAEAGARGFTRFQLMATLPGVAMYLRCGYVSGEPERHPLPGGGTIEFVPMSRVARVTSR